MLNINIPQTPTDSIKLIEQNQTIDDDDNIERTGGANNINYFYVIFLFVLLQIIYISFL